MTNKIIARVELPCKQDFGVLPGAANTPDNTPDGQEKSVGLAQYFSHAEDNDQNKGDHQRNDADVQILAQRLEAAA